MSTRPTDRLMALSVQWMRDKISTSEVCEQMGWKQTQVTYCVYKLAIALRAACREGLVK